MSNTIRIGVVQTHASSDPGDNLDRNVALVEEAAGNGANVVCLQELFRSHYFPQAEDDANFALAEALPGPTTKRLASVARANGIVLVASVFEKRAPGLFHNSAAVLDADGSFKGCYRKMHIPDDPRFYEKFYFTPGDLGFRAFDTRFGRIGVLICWDQWYPEAARLTALAGAQVLFYPTAIGTWTGEMDLLERQHDAWRTVQRGHAVANGVFVAAANRIGEEGQIHFWGRSFLAAPDGRVLTEADEHETVLVAECDLGEIDAAREGWPFLRDRRIDAYDDLSKRYLDSEPRD